MNVKEKITISDFGDKTFKIRVVEPKNEKKASFTHYLHNPFFTLYSINHFNSYSFIFDILFY